MLVVVVVVVAVGRDISLLGAFARIIDSSLSDRSAGNASRWNSRPVMNRDRINELSGLACCASIPALRTNVRPT